MSSSFPLEVLDSGKSALISSYLNVSTTETESNFWKKLAMMQNSDYNPENMHKGNCTVYLIFNFSKWTVYS